MSGSRSPGLTQIHPALERVVGPRLGTKQGLAVIEQLGGPQGITTASKSKLLRVITKAYPPLRVLDRHRTDRRVVG